MVNCLKWFRGFPSNTSLLLNDVKEVWKTVEETHGEVGERHGGQEVVGDRPHAGVPEDDPEDAAVEGDGDANHQPVDHNPKHLLLLIVAHN